VGAQKLQIPDLHRVLPADFSDDARHRLGCPERSSADAGLSMSTPSSAVAKRLE